LVRVNLDDLEHDAWLTPESAYGMTVDHLGRPWTCNVKVARFDPQTEGWTVGAAEPGYGGAGCMEDAQGRMWVAGYAITAIDVDTMELLDTFAMPVMNGNPDTGYGRGISIDFEGYVWSPSHWSNAAYRLDPQTGEFDKVDGLDFPYTYSDMTGFALANAGVPQG
jgi:streptogramin lyase